ncbi:MAG: low-complexity tail membrane protein [Leptolyngbyaceae cyanobacterium]
MTSHRRDPYLWIHFTGLATVPLWLDICLGGLAVGEPILSPWLELIVVGVVGTVPITWMQLQRPFYIFSVPGLALRPDKLPDERRRLLRLQRGWISRGLVVIAAIALLMTLYWLYRLSPIVAEVPFLVGKSPFVLLAICSMAFLLANLFTLVPATVIPLLLVSPQRLTKVEPLSASDILTHFTIVGLRIGRILPEFVQYFQPTASDTLTSGASNDAPPAADTSSIDGALDNAGKEPLMAATSPAAMEGLDHDTAADGDVESSAYPSASSDISPGAEVTNAQDGEEVTESPLDTESSLSGNLPTTELEQTAQKPKEISQPHISGEDESGNDQELLSQPNSPISASEPIPTSNPVNAPGTIDAEPVADAHAAAVTEASETGSIAAQLDSVNSLNDIKITQDDDPDVSYSTNPAD